MVDFPPLSFFFSPASPVNRFLRPRFQALRPCTLRPCRPRQPGRPHPPSPCTRRAFSALGLAVAGALFLEGPACVSGHSSKHHCSELPEHGPAVSEWGPLPWRGAAGLWPGLLAAPPGVSACLLPRGPTRAPPPCHWGPRGLLPRNQPLQVWLWCSRRHPAWTRLPTLHPPPLAFLAHGHSACRGHTPQAREESGLGSRWAAQGPHCPPVICVPCRGACSPPAPSSGGLQGFRGSQDAAVLGIVGPWEPRGGPAGPDGVVASELQSPRAAPGEGVSAGAQVPERGADSRAGAGGGG